MTILFLMVVVPPTIALVWLGMQLLDQDRALEVQRTVERRDAAIQAATLSLEQSLADAQRWLVDDALPEGMVRLTLSHSRVDVVPANRIAWIPAPPAMAPAATREFVEAEQAEFRGDGAPALDTYTRLSASSSPAVRAGALLRVARVHRRARAWDRALTAYRELATIDRVAIDEMPADLIAQRAIGFVLEEAARTQDLARHVAALETDLLSGRWRLEPAVWQLTADQLTRWAGIPVTASPETRVFSAVAETLWREWQQRGASSAQTLSRRVIAAENVPLTVLMRTDAPGTMTAVAIQPHVVAAWVQRAAERAGSITLLSDTGEVIAGPPSDPATVRRSAAESGLPWTMAFRADMTRPADVLSGRRRLLMAGLAAIVLLLAGSGAVLWRVVLQQLAVARLRTNFVAAVSHEFRTPLASLRHVTELLTENDVLPAEQRRSFYEVLARNTDRLQRLVESLLDFSRMEEGRKPYDITAIRAGALTRQVVAEFVREGRVAEGDVDLQVEAAADVAIQVDPTAVSQALWNVLDNAVKYSRGQPIIQISVARHDEGVAIRVSDRGLGIPPAERRQIFGKFVRGEQARRLGIKGTGLGLAIVSHIVQAHGGTIELESREGVGTAFILVFPAAGAAAI